MWEGIMNGELTGVRHVFECALWGVVTVFF